MDYLILVSFLSLAFWVFLTFFHGRTDFLKNFHFWSNKIVFENFLAYSIKKKLNKKICVIIPARNEEKTILRTIKSIEDQKINNLEIIVVDDNSTDKTSEIVNKFKRKFKKISLLSGKKLPNGWVGKTWALKQAVDFANRKKYDYYVFIDSDIIIERNLLMNVSKFIDNNDLEMVSLMAKLKCRTVWEKILIPPFIFFFQKIYPFNLVIDKNSKIAAAAGGFIFCKAKIFQHQNLYDLIPNKVIDDCNIAKLIKKRGSIWLGLTNRVTSERQYNSLKEIWKMVSRTAFEQLNYSILQLLLSLFGLFVIYIHPYLGLIYSLQNLENDYLFPLLLLVNILSISFMILTFSPTIKFYKIGKFFTFTLPLSAIIYGCITLSSAINYFFFAGNNWKGRKY